MTPEEQLAKLLADAKRDLTPAELTELYKYLFDKFAANGVMKP